MSNPIGQTPSLNDRFGPRAADGGSRALHAVAMLTAIATFPLIFMGGLVTSHHAGMSVPDWPNSYGYNMFLFPPNQWVGGVLYEHTHRLMGTVVGFCAVVLTLVAWGFAANPVTRRRLGRAAALLAVAALSLAGVRIALGSRLDEHARSILAQSVVGFVGLLLVVLVAYWARHPEPRRWVRWLCAGVLGMVLFQGLLGGLRVVLVKLDLAIVHACVAQAFFCLATFAAIVTSRWWKSADASSLPHQNAIRGRGLAVLGLATVVVIYLQLIVGAMMRHFGAGLAIPDLPLAYGHWLPPLNDEGLAAINHYRAFTLNLDPVTLWQVWIHFAHRIGALLVSGFAVSFAIVILRRHRRAGLVAPAITLLLLLAAQVTLGILTVLLRKPADVASLHVATGALVLVTSFLLTTRVFRLYRPQWTTAKSRMVEQDFEKSAAGHRADSRFVTT